MEGGFLLASWGFHGSKFLLEPKERMQGFLIRCGQMRREKSVLESCQPRSKMQAVIYRMDKRGHPVQHRELYSRSCDKPHGEEYEKESICMHY